MIFPEGEEYLAVLWHEFFAEEGSFLLQMRIDLYWDKAAFSRLTGAMRECCKRYGYVQGTEAGRIQALQMKLPRWLAAGFWYVSHLIRDFTSHPAWDKKRNLEPDYYNKAYQLLDELALWFFEGYSPRQNEDRGKTGW